MDLGDEIVLSPDAELDDDRGVDSGNPESNYQPDDQQDTTEAFDAGLKIDGPDEDHVLEPDGGNMTSNGRGIEDTKLLDDSKSKDRESHDGGHEANENNSPEIDETKGESGQPEEPESNLGPQPTKPVPKTEISTDDPNRPEDDLTTQPHHEPVLPTDNEPAKAENVPVDPPAPPVAGPERPVDQVVPTPEKTADTLPGIYPVNQQKTPTTGMNRSVQIIASAMNTDMQQNAVNLIIEAHSQFSDHMMAIAHHAVSNFEKLYGPAWCCVVSDGQLGFFVRYDPNDHIYFTANGLTVFLYKCQKH